MKLQNKTKPNSNQDVLNRVWKHFITDCNRKCLDEDQGSMYRNNEGEACAIGIMMPDYMANQLNKKNYSIRSLMVERHMPTVHPKVKKWFDKCSPEFLMKVQYWHDKQDLNRACLQKIASSFNLKIPTA